MHTHWVPSSVCGRCSSPHSRLAKLNLQVLKLHERFRFRSKLDLSFVSCSFHYVLVVTSISRWDSMNPMTLVLTESDAVTGVLRPTAQKTMRKPFGMNAHVEPCLLSASSDSSESFGSTRFLDVLVLLDFYSFLGCRTSWSSVFVSLFPSANGLSSCTSLSSGHGASSLSACAIEFENKKLFCHAKSIFWMQI